MLKTPMRKVENKEKIQSGSQVHHHHANNQKMMMKETKQTQAATPHRKQVTGAKSRKEKQPQFAWIQNSYGHPVKKPMTGGKDEWIGSL